MLYVPHIQLGLSMKKILLILLFLLSINSQAILPLWLDPVSVPEGFDPQQCETDLPITAVELVQKYFNPEFPGGKLQTLIGYKVDLTQKAITGDTMLFFKYKEIEEAIDMHTTLHWFKDSNTLIPLDMGKDINFDPMGMNGNNLIYKWGYTEGNGDYGVQFPGYNPLAGMITCKNRITNQMHIIQISGALTTYINNLEIEEKELNVHSKSRQPLVRGRVRFERLAGMANRDGEVEFDVDIKDGKIDKDGEFDELRLSAGHYRVELLKPSECGDEAINENFIITPEMLESDKPIDVEIVCSYAYDMTMIGRIETNNVQGGRENGGTLNFKLSATEFLTHDAELTDEEINEATLEFDREGYPLDILGERVTLPMRLPFQDRRVYYSSWAEEIELEYATYEDHNTGRVSECELVEGNFGFVRVNKAFQYLPGRVSEKGAYPNLDATLVCYIDTGEDLIEMDVPIYIGPLGPHAPGGWFNSFVIPMDEEQQEQLLESEESFVQTYTTNSKSNNGVKFNMSLQFDGYFTKKEYRKPVTTPGDGDGNGDGSGGGAIEPFIFTDMVTVDNSESELSIEVVANFEKVKTLSYVAKCHKESGPSELIGKGTLDFRLMQTPYGMGRKIMPIKNPKICKTISVDFDNESQYPEAAFSPAKRFVLTNSANGNWEDEF